MQMKLYLIETFQYNDYANKLALAKIGDAPQCKQRPMPEVPRVGDQPNPHHWPRGKQPDRYPPRVDHPS